MFASCLASKSFTGRKQTDPWQLNQLSYGKLLLCLGSSLSPTTSSLKSGPDPTNQKCLEVVFTVCKVLTYSTVVVFQALLSPCHRCSLCMNCECCFWHYNTKQVYIATGWVVLIHCSSKRMGINASKPHSFLLGAARPRGWGCVTRVVNLITHAWFNFCNHLVHGQQRIAWSLPALE